MPSIETARRRAMTRTHAKGHRMKWWRRKDSFLGRCQRLGCHAEVIVTADKTTGAADAMTCKGHR